MKIIMIESILADLETHLGFPSYKGKDQSEGFYIVQISQSEEVWVKDLNPGFFLRSIIAPMSFEGDREAFLSYLMKANFLGQGTGGGVISLDPNEKFLFMSLCINYEVNYRIFRDKLEDFINYVEYWRTEIKKHETGQVS